MLEGTIMLIDCRQSTVRSMAAAVLFILIIVLALCGRSYGKADLIFSKVDRKIDLTSQNVRSITSLKVENRGSTSVSEILFALPSNQAGNVAFIGASTVEGKGKNKASPKNLPIKLDESNTSPSNVVQFTILITELQPGGSAALDVYIVFTHSLKPFPAEILQSDAQLVLYHDTAHVTLPYPSKTQMTSLKMLGPRVESYTQVDPIKLTNGELKYGPYEDVPAYSFQPITIHYEFNQPIVVIEELVREIEISNWGNIYVTENYHVKHGGARHIGSFSRLDYQARPHLSGVSSLRQLFGRLPPRVHSVYYRDEIGNISTSHLRTDKHKTDLEFEPRYPLFGGWRVTFTIGYGVPLEDFVFLSSDGRRFLKFPFGCPLQDVVVNNLIVKVVLPEGSKDPSVQTPFPVQQWQEVKQSYLDTVGRMVVVLSKKNVVQEHNVYFEVYFKFSTITMLVEPLMLVASFFLFFMACIAYSRLDFSISKSSASYQARLHREELADSVQKLQKVLNMRSVSVSDKLEASLRDLARTGDVQNCKAARKSADAVLKETAKSLKTIQEAFQSSRSLNIATKVESLISKEREKQEKLLQKHTVTLEAYERKLSSKEIDNRVAPYQQKIAALTDEINDLLESLDEF